MQQSTTVSPANLGGVRVLKVFHADSLAGPMRELKRRFEAANSDATVNLTSGTSKQLAKRILDGDTCDVFASSSPAVISGDLMRGTVAGSDQACASWYIVFSANELVVIVGKGNPHAIQRIGDLARPGLKFIRVTGEMDMATNRIDIIRFPARVNMSDEIRNAATVPNNARNAADGLRFVRFLLTPEGRSTLKEAGQPPVSPPICEGRLPQGLEIRC